MASTICISAINSSEKKPYFLIVWVGEKKKNQTQNDTKPLTHTELKAKELFKKKTKPPLKKPNPKHNPEILMFFHIVH